MNRLACSQVAAASLRVKQTGKNTVEPRETRGISFHCHCQMTQVFSQFETSGRTAGGVHDVQAKPVKVFQESTPSSARNLAFAEDAPASSAKAKLGAG